MNYNTVAEILYLILMFLVVILVPEAHGLLFVLAVCFLGLKIEDLGDKMKR